MSESLKQTSTLLLLVHLYILNYPYVNNTEYDHDLFNPRIRGLRDRTKAMEDITYFLVQLIEGGSPKTLPMYPCRQPSESLAFRTSLSKYLEQLRHHSIRPPRAGSSSAGVDSNNLTAPWWKDVVVRKSLLEGSAGEKFDRLLLSLSTHALMKASHSIPKETMRARLHSEPVSYANSLIKYQSIRHSWTRSASSLLRCQCDLKSLRAKLQNQSTYLSSKYERLPTASLVALAHSKYQDLLNSCAEETRPILVSFVELSGICNPFELPTLTDTADAPCPLFSSQPLPLPIAAAHHPSYVKKFQHPLLRGSKKDTGEIIPLKSHAEMAFAVQIEAEKRIHQVLANTVSRIGNRLLELRKTIASKYPPPPLDTMSIFLQPLPKPFDIAYNPKPVKELLDSMGLGEDFDLLELDAEIDHELEKRVSNIRTSILPPFPVPSNELSLPRLRNTPIEHPQLTTGTGVSHIPQPLKQPSKSKRSIRPIRKSVRFSTARRLAGRPSIFGAVEDLDNSLDCLINETHDFPTDGEGTDEEIPLSSPFKIPNIRRKTPKVNRIWLPGTPASGIKGRTPKPRGSEAHALERLFEDKPLAIELPSLDSLNSSTLSLLDDPAHLDMDIHPTNSPTMFNGNGDGMSVDEDDGFVNDQPSLTLKELLLNADTGQFEFLADAEDESLSSSYLTNELSFSWE